MSEIAVVGTGYVGLTTGAYLAHLGHNVVCADVIPEKVERLSRGEIPIVEPGLEELVAEGIREDRLRFVLGAAEGAKDAEFIFLAVPTPQGDDGSADLQYVETAAAQIAPVLRRGAVVINKSTVPVGSTKVVEKALQRPDVFVVSNPEFLREGSAVYDCLNPDRIVIGSEHQEAAIRVSTLFSKLQAPLIITDPSSAETIKYASNAFLAAKISFINAMANVCEAVGADVREVSLGMGYDKRIGFEFLKPGPGWGGSCFVPDETLLVRRGDDVQLVTFAELADLVDSHGLAGMETLAWTDELPTPEFFPLAAFTRRPYDGDIVTAVTKMGRRVSVTADHPFVVGDGTIDQTMWVERADELTTADWLPIAQHGPILWTENPNAGYVLPAAEAAGIASENLIIRLSERQQKELQRLRMDVPWQRRRDVERCGAMRLGELQALGIDPEGGLVGTVTNGTYVPLNIPFSLDFWEMVGLFLAEGHIGTDGARKRICWSFHPTDESHLADKIEQFWTNLGVKVTRRRLATALQVSISSRVLAAWFEHGLGVGKNSYDKRIPNAVWSQGNDAKRALLGGLWDGDGSWSLVRGGPSVALEYGTVSRRLADGMLRLLGDLGVVARLKVGRTTKSTVDTYWLVVSGADQIEDALWLVPAEEQDEIRASVAGQQKRIAPTGYRRLSKGAAWARIVRIGRSHYEGDVFSVEVPGPHTVVTTGGLIVHNCFPKDSRALVKIAEDAGYDFALMRGVIDVNDQQYDKIAEKVIAAAGGSLQGKTIGIWGLTFKANTDDLRDSPSLYVIDRLKAAGATVRGYDVTQLRPDAPKHKSLEGVEVCADAYAAVDGADVLAVLTEWDEFRWLDFDKVRASMSGIAVVDARNLLDGAQLRRKGFGYTGVGRP